MPASKPGPRFVVSCLPEMEFMRRDGLLVDFSPQMGTEEETHKNLCQHARDLLLGPVHALEP